MRRSFIRGGSLLAPIAAVLVACGPLAAQAGMLGFGTNPGAVWTPDNGPLNQTPLTVEAWFLANGSSFGGSGTIVRKGDSFLTFSLWQSQPFGGFLIADLRIVGAPQGLQSLIAPQALQSNTWYHAALTYDATAAYLYLNGVLQDSIALLSAPLGTPGEPLLIGNVQGYLDEVRIWSTLRSQAEIVETMFLRMDHHPNLISAWHFDGGLLDLTGLHHGSVPFGSAVTLPSTSPVGPLLAGPQSISIWSPLVFAISHCAPSSPYLLEVSATGTSPGIPIPLPFPAGTFPLNPPLLFSTYGPSFPGLFSGFSGSTDALGTATGSLLIPAEPALIGIQLSAAFAAFDAGAGGTMFAGVSLARTTAITDYPQLAINQVHPSIAQPGTTVTVTGQGFRPGTTLDVSGAPANVLSIEPSQITFATPAGIPCDALLTLTNAGGQASARFNPSPVIVSTSNASGPSSGGQTMFLIGANFAPGTTVTIGGTPAQVSFSFETILGVVVPPGSPGPAQVVVTSPTGCTDSTVFDYY